MYDYEFIDGTRLSNVIESIIFASPEPLSAQKLCDLIQQGDEQLELEPEAIAKYVNKLNERYEENGMAFKIQKVAGGFTFSTRKKYDSWLSIFQHENAYRKLSQSAIETLAIVAYKQPVTKPEVDEIRGVDSGYILRQLLEKVLIEVSGRLDAPGKPLVYRTTNHFLQHFGINSVDELPKPREIEEILSDDDMAEHRQYLFDRQLELKELDENRNGQKANENRHNGVSLIEVVENLNGESDDNNNRTVGEDDTVKQNNNGEEEIEDVVST